MKLSIVIPAFNEALRLPESLQHLSNFLSKSTFVDSHSCEIIIVDDGSQDRTFDVATSFNDKFSHTKVFRLPENQGKGAAIREGIRNSVGEWVLVADADMATPWREVDRFLTYQTNNDVDMLIGSRALKESDIKTRQPLFRETMGKIFNFIIRMITGLSFRDTQCGFKLMRGQWARKLCPLLRVNRFAWDVEFLMMAKLAGASIQDRPVEWHHREASRVRPIVDSLEMLLATLKMRAYIEINRNKLLKILSI